MTKPVRLVDPVTKKGWTAVPDEALESVRGRVGFVTSGMTRRGKAATLAGVILATSLGALSLDALQHHARMRISQAVESVERGNVHYAGKAREAKAEGRVPERWSVLDAFSWGGAEIGLGDWEDRDRRAREAAAAVELRDSIQASEAIDQQARRGAPVRFADALRPPPAASPRSSVEERPGMRPPNVALPERRRRESEKLGPRR